jgi:hypothetical protein
VSDVDVVGALRQAGQMHVSSQALPHENNIEEFAAYIHRTYQYIKRNRKLFSTKISIPVDDADKVTAIQSLIDNEFVEIFQFENDTFDLVVGNNASVDADSESKVLWNALKPLRKSGMQMYTNLYLDITPCIPDASDTVEFPHPLRVAEVVGNLCDNGSDVINFTFCRPTEFASLDIDGDQLVDFLRECLEECIGVDTDGEPLLERLSVQPMVGQQQIADLAKSLGLTRYAICGTDEEIAVQIPCVIEKDTRPYGIERPVYMKHPEFYPLVKDRLG